MQLGLRSASCCAFSLLVQHLRLLLNCTCGADWRQSGNRAGNAPAASPGDQDEMAALQMAPNIAALWSGDIQAAASWDEHAARAVYAR